MKQSEKVIIYSALDLFAANIQDAIKKDLHDADLRQELTLTKALMKKYDPKGSKEGHNGTAKKSRKTVAKKPAARKRG